MSASSPTHGASAELAALLPEFEFLRELGRGGAAVVYLARDRELGRQVAVKIVRDRFLDDTETAARFAREARTVARLQHPNIVAVYGARRLSNGGLALVMQHIAGRTLKQVVREQGPLPFPLAEQVLSDIASALVHAHQHRVVHRDIKPENIYLHEESGRALLADFGIAKAIDGESNLTLNGTVIGTPAYMSPEQVDGREVDGRSDLYSLGLVGYEMLTGKRPWEGETLYSIIYKQKHEELPPLLEQRPDMPAALHAALRGALHKEREQRWSGVAEFAARLAPRPDAGAPESAREGHRLQGASDAAPAEDEDAHTIRYRKHAPTTAEGVGVPPQVLATVEPSPELPPAALVERAETGLRAGPARRARRVLTRRWVVIAVLVLILGAGATLLARTGMKPGVPVAEASEPVAATQQFDDAPAPTAGEPSATEQDAEVVSTGESEPVVEPAPAAPSPKPLTHPQREAPRSTAARAASAPARRGDEAAPRLADPRVEVRAAPQPALAGERAAAPSLSRVAVAPRLRNRGAVEAAWAASLPQAEAAAGASVSLWVLVSADGRVRDTRVNGSSGSTAVDGAAQRAAGRMEFDPAVGQTTLMWVSVALRVPGS